MVLRLGISQTTITDILEALFDLPVYKYFNLFTKRGRERICTDEIQPLSLIAAVRKLHYAK